MTFELIPWYVMLHAISLGISLCIYVLVRGYLQLLLDRVLKLSAGTSFYLRALLLSLLLTALAGSVGKSFDSKPEARFMEHVWTLASGLADVFQNVTTVLIVYVILITILVAALKIKE